MGALDGAKLAGRVLADEPLLVAAAAGIAAIAALLNGLWSIPLLGIFVGPAAVLLYVFVEPYVAAGYLGAVDEAIDGDLSRATFRERAGEHYTDLLVARLVILVPAVVYAALVRAGRMGLTAGVGLTVAERTATGGLGPSLVDALRDGLTPDPATLFALAVVALVLAVGLAGYVLVQFYPAAIVVGGAGPLESFRYSYELVRAYPLPALGYTALTALAGVALVTPAVVNLGARLVARRSALATGEPGAVLAGTLGAMVASLVTFLLVKTAVVAFVRSYHVSFVRSTLGRS